MTREAGRVGELRIPCTRGVDQELRRKRLLAARGFAIGSVPRVAILLGHWDGGEIVGMAAKLKEREVGKRRRRKDRIADCGKRAGSRKLDRSGNRKPRKV